MNDLIENVIIFVLGACSTGTIAIWIFRNRNALISLAAWFYRTFSWVAKRLEYGNVAYNIEATVNRAGEILDRQASDVLPYPIKITWAKTSQELEASLRKGEIVVTMQYSPNRDRNLVVSTLAYLRKGLLPRARSYVDRTLMKAADFTVAKQVFLSSGQEMAVPFFFENYLEPATEENPNLRDDLTRLERMNEAGFFTRVFLREVKHLGDKVYPATPNKRTWEETREFSGFLEVIAEKERGVDIPGGLMFPGSRIRASLMLIARPKTRLSGTEPYVRRIGIDLNRGVERMYVFARGSGNISFTDEVLTEAEEAEMLRPIARFYYSQSADGREQPVICVVCALNILMRPSEEAAPSQILMEVLREHIPELADGKIEAVAAARQSGLKSKIAVRSVYKDLDAIACCTQHNRRDAIEIALGEDVEYIPWLNKPEDLIVAALYPLQDDMVVEIELDEERKVSEVKVDGWKAKRKALGKGDINLKLAMELTGWRIKVVDSAEEVSGQIEAD
jgi:transcription antitermination factor NusA-like protein